MRSLLLAATLLAAASVSAQGRLAFEAERHDFGRIAEGGVAIHTFRFTNTGDEPIRLTRVEAACGCTTPSWTEVEIEPGAGGTVEVVYDPAGRPGAFEKSVLVEAEGANPSAVTLRIVGVVRPALAETGVRMGSLAFDQAEADAGLVLADGGFQVAFQFANVGSRPVRIDSVSAPDGVEVVYPERPLFPDQLGGLFVHAPNWRAGQPTSGHGFEMDLIVHTDDPETPDKRLHVNGRVEVLRARADGRIDVNEE